MPHLTQSALAAVSEMPNLRMGQLVQHKDAPGEHFFIERFDGRNRANGFQWKVWVRGVERCSEIPFPANAYELQPVTIN